MKKYLALCVLLACSVSQAYRDQETGTFLTRDPIGYEDGPNVYCYAHCNPITQFDAFGLYVGATTESGEDGSLHTEFEISASIVFEDPVLNELNEDGTYVHQDKRDAIEQGIKDSLMEGYNGKDGSHTWSLNEQNLDISIAGSTKDVAENNHIIVVAALDHKNPTLSPAAPARAEEGGGMVWMTAEIATDNKAPAHEFVHSFGLKDQEENRRPNLTWQNVWSGSMELTSPLVKQIQRNVDQPEALNNNLGPRQDSSRMPVKYQALEAARPPKRKYPRIIDGKAYYDD